MSNEFAIAAVTITLRNLLDPVRGLSDPSLSGSFPTDAAPTAEIVINNLPLDEAHDFDDSKNQVNIFLYYVEHSAAWKNMPVPGSVRNGESGHPPLGVNLYYLITAYGQRHNEIIGHVLLGKSMSILHDHPVLSRQEIQLAFPGSLLHEQIERIRITPQPISVDDVSKLWTGFQTQYKLSVAYQVSVVLIESKRAARTPLPVLMRGEGDKGVFVQPYVIPPFPTLESVQYPFGRQGVQPGDEQVIKGHHLLGDSVTLLFRHMVTGIELSRPVSGTPADAEIRFTVPVAEPTVWPPGLYSVKAVIHTASEPDKISNELAFALLPVISNIQIIPLTPPVPKGYEAVITFSPLVQPNQQAYLLLGSQAFSALPHAAAANVLHFEMRNVEPGDYYIRLRIDGADSLLVVDTVAPPVFNPAYKVTIT